MAETVVALGHTVVVERGPLAIKPPRVRVAGEDAARVVLAWAQTPDGRAKVAGVRLRLLGEAPFAKAAGAAELDAAALAEALRAGTLVAHAAAPLALPPPPAPSPPAAGELLAALAVRDLTGTPLRGVELEGRWDDGTLARVTTGPAGVAVWRRTAAAAQATLTVRQLDAQAYVECVLEDAGWRARGAPAPRALVCRPGRPEVGTVYLRLPHVLRQRFAWQREAMREHFYPFRVLMLRRFLRLHRESEEAERLAQDALLRERTLGELEDQLDALNESVDDGAKDEALQRLKQPLRGLWVRTKQGHFALVGRELPQLARFRANRWALQQDVWRAGHRRLLQAVKDAYAQRPGAYPAWARYLTVHFSGMVYASAHGSVGRPDTLIRMLRLGGGKAVQKSAAGAKEAEPGNELHAELAAASAEVLVALAAEPGAWSPPWLERLGAAKALAEPVRALRQAVAELATAQRLLPASGLDGGVLGGLRTRVEALWRAATPAFLDRAPHADWLAHLVERAPKWAPVGNGFAPFPMEAWTPVVAYTPLRADFEVRFDVALDPKNPTPAARFKHAFPPLPERAWGTFLRAWLGKLAEKPDNVGAETQWNDYHARTLEPVIRGVCNQNNEMSYRARGYFPRSGGGLRDNALNLFESKGGLFQRLTSSDPAYLLDKVRVGSSLFYLGLTDDPFLPEEGWNVVDPKMRAIVGGVPAVRDVAGVGRREVLLFQSHVTLSPALQERGEPERDVTARTWILKWTHEAVVLRVDPVLQRVLLHDTSAPTGFHAKSFSKLVNVYVGTPGEAVTREAEVEALLDLERLLPASDDGPDPELPKAFFDDGLLRDVRESDGPLPE